MSAVGTLLICVGGLMIGWHMVDMPPWAILGVVVLIIGLLLQ